MKDILSIVTMNFIFLPLVINTNLKYSNELLAPIVGQKNVYLSNKTRSILLLRSISKSGVPKVRILGFIHYITVAYPSLWFAVVIVVLSLIQIVKVAFGLNFKWFSTAILVLSSFGLMGYSTVMIVIFGFLSWVFKRKRGL